MSTDDTNGRWIQLFADFAVLTAKNGKDLQTFINKSLTLFVRGESWFNTVCKKTKLKSSLSNSKVLSF